MAYSGPFALPIVAGGTNATSMTNTDGVVYFDGTRLATTTVGTAAQVLTSNGVGLAPTFQAGGGGSGASTFHTGTGDATVAAGAITIAGTAPISTTGSGSTVTVALATPVTVANGGTGRATLTTHGVLVGATTAAITQLAAGSDGQLLCGATGADPAFTTVTSSSLSFTPGAHTLAINVTAPLSVGNGGTGRTTLTTHGLLVGATTAAITQLAAGAVNTLLQGQGAADPAFTGSPSVSGSLTAATNVTATAGTVSAGTTVTAGTNLVSTAGNLSLPNSSATIGQIQFAGQPYIHNFGSGGGNFFVGRLAGNLTNTGGENCGFGDQCLTALTVGGNNQCFGAFTLTGLTSGSNNLALGNSAGTSYTTESDNIVLSNTGTAADANTIRIGTQGTSTGQQNKCFIAGIFGVTVGVSGIPVVIDNTGQLGTVVSSKRFKENIKDIGDTSDILNLRPVNFNFINDSTKTKQWGLIAEEVNEQYPDLVVYDSERLPFTVRYHDLPVLLLNEIKKLVKRIEVLEQNVK